MEQAKFFVIKTVAFVAFLLVNEKVRALQYDMRIEQLDPGSVFAGEIHTYKVVGIGTTLDENCLFGWNVTGGTVVGNNPATGTTVQIQWTTAGQGSISVGDYCTQNENSEPFNIVIHPDAYQIQITQPTFGEGHYYGGETHYSAQGIGFTIDPNAQYYWTVNGGTVVGANPVTGPNVLIKWNENIMGSVKVVSLNQPLRSEPYDNVSINKILGQETISFQTGQTATPNYTYSVNIPFTSFFDATTTHQYPYNSVSWNIVGGEIISQPVYPTVDDPITVKWTAPNGYLTANVEYGYWDLSDPEHNENFVEYQEFVIFRPIPNQIITSHQGTEETGSCGYIPDDLMEDYASEGTPFITGYQWQKSSDGNNGFEDISGATEKTYHFTSPIDQTTYFRRKITTESGDFSYSNVLKFEFNNSDVPNYENLNYVREYTVATPGIKTRCEVYDLNIGDKFVTTTYFDGLNRQIQTVSRETATPQGTNSTWGDIVQYSVYDQTGRQPAQYLPFPTLGDPGKFKQDTDQDPYSYYTNNYGEFSYSATTFDNTPLSRVANIKLPGSSWQNSSGQSFTYDVFNTTPENIPIVEIGYDYNDIPAKIGYYPANSLFKKTSTDENGKKVIEFVNKSGELIYKKVQLDGNAQEEGPTGWICTYNVYDDFGKLRFTLEPEAVKYFAANSWNFNTDEAKAVLKELCFRYEYDEKGRTVVKKNPGADEIAMIYDKRDRLVFVQDGNQRLTNTNKLLPQWTVNLYDELDRPVITTLYNTNKNQDQLKALFNTGTNTAVTITNQSQPIIDLIVDKRESATLTHYKATNSIEFVSNGDNNFESLPDDNFETEITKEAAQTIEVSVTAYNSPFSEEDFSTGAITVLKYIFYDGYDFATVRAFDKGFTNAQAYTIGGAVEPIANTDRTINFITGSMVRILGTETFLSTTTYYDENGRAVQSLADNIKKATDIETNQYHWSGRLMSTDLRHTVPSTAFSKYSILTKNTFDKIGRVILVEKKFGTNAFKKIVSYEYDELGKVKKKHLDPDYTEVDGNADIETLNYSYNIQNQLTGINREYALKGTNYNKWGNAYGKFFGLSLFYDKNINDEATNLLTGQISSQVWNTMGDDAQRKYDYSYDNTGRLAKADFNEREKISEAWVNNKIDFSVGSNQTDGKIKYDLNGNILFMSHKGVVIGNPSPLLVDNLAYNYFPVMAGSTVLGNKLKGVKDNGDLANINGILGDFKDGANTGNPDDDYVYDNNGNLVIDLNKGLKDLQGGIDNTGIKYNYLDKPEEIHIKDKGTVKITYDADGYKLQRTFESDGPDATQTTTTYINAFVYKEVISTSVTQPFYLSYINFEEGRIRPITEKDEIEPTNGYDRMKIAGTMDLPGGKGVYDFYISDHLQNVRMIVTEEEHSGYNTMTLETDRRTPEQNIFGLANEGFLSKVDKASIPGDGWSDPEIGTYVSKLMKSDKKIGSNALLKVMAGDEISASSLYFYNETPGNTAETNTVLQSLLNSLINTIAGSPLTPGSIKSSNVADNLIHSQFDNNINQGFTSIIAPNQMDADDIPKAYLSILFFDERFKFVDGESIRVGGPGNNPEPYPLSLTEIKAPKNGYVFVYVSNESNTPVYFDNFRVMHTRGRILEENHYYPFGLKIAAISSSKLADINEGDTKNNYLYQGEYNELDNDLGWNDFELRNYDPQIGRWIQQDPYEQHSSPYVGMGNDPIRSVDKNGGWDQWMTNALIGGAVGLAIPYIAEALQKDHKKIANKGLWALGGALLGAATTDLSPGLTGAVYGAAAGFLAPYALEYFKGKHISNKGLWGLGGALLGSGFGYAITESISPGTNSIGAPPNPSKNFLSNFLVFYPGLLGINATKQVGGEYVAWSPNINLLAFRDNNLPDWDYWRILKQKSDPDFHLSKVGKLWRKITTGEGGDIAPFYTFSPRWIFRLIPIIKAPVLLWYIYSIIHKQKEKNIGPYLDWF